MLDSVLVALFVFVVIAWTMMVWYGIRREFGATFSIRPTSVVSAIRKRRNRHERRVRELKAKLQRAEELEARLCSELGGTRTDVWLKEELARKKAELEDRLAVARLHAITREINEL